MASVGMLMVRATLPRLCLAVSSLNFAAFSKRSLSSPWNSFSSRSSRSRTLAPFTSKASRNGIQPSPSPPSCTSRKSDLMTRRLIAPPARMPPPGLARLRLSPGFGGRCSSCTEVSSAASSANFCS